MSRVVATSVLNAAGTKVLVPNSGNIIQTIFVRTDSRVVYNNATGFGSRIAELDLAITPHGLGNIILAEWNVSGHVDNGSAINILVDNNPYPSSLLKTGFSPASATGYGSVSYGYASPNYDGNANNTLQNICVTFALRAESTSSMNIGIQFFGVNFFLNRTETGTLADDSESGVSTGIAYEISYI